MHSALVGLAVLATPLAAHAIDRTPSRLEFNVGAFWSRVGLPAAILAPAAAVTETRNYGPNAKMPLGDANFSMVGAGSSLVFHDRWVFPILQLSSGVVTGPSPDLLTSIDGDPARTSLRGAFRADFGFGGFGMRAQARRWSFGFRVVPTVVLVGNIRARVPDGVGERSLLLNSIYFALRTEFEGCRRLDPLTRLCVVGAPSLFDARFANGFTLGVRMDLGL